MKTILIAIPTDKNIEPATFKSIYDLHVPQGYQVHFQYFYGYMVDQVRNLIASWAVNYDYLFAVDHDVTFPPDTLHKLLSHEKDMVTALYRQRLPTQVLEVWDFSGTNIPYEHIKGRGLVRVGGCGFGCVLVNSSVFKGIPYPQFVYKSAIDHKHTQSEDWYFCLQAITRGFEIYADTSILCSHIGSVPFVIEDEKPTHNSVQKRLLELHDMDLLPQKHADFLRSIPEPKVVYDIGSCVLHWTNKAKPLWPRAEFVLFEAMDEVGFLYDERGFDKYNLGVLTEKDETVVKFNLNVEHPGGNSYFDENPELSPRAKELFPDDKKVRRIGMSLDTVVKERNFPLPDLIKMDIQGAELDVLKGATETLKSCNYLILELQHKDYNFGAPKKDEIIEYVKSLGFSTTAVPFCGGDLGVDGDYYFERIIP